MQGTHSWKRILSAILLLSFVLFAVTPALADELEEKKQHFSQEHYSECILCMQKRNIGN